LIESKVHLAALDRLPSDFVDRLPKGGIKGAGLGLVGQDVPVCQVKDACLAPPVPQPPGDLHGDKGLARAGRHREQDAWLAFDDRFHGAVDGDLLIVARRLAADLFEIGAQRVLGVRRVVQPLDAAQPCPEFIG